MLAGHGAARAGASAALIRFAAGLGLPVATTFHGKGVFPDDHPNALGAVGFMSHDYVNFGFDQADVIVCVGYELQEFDPARINPTSDKQIIHLSRLPAEVDNHYSVDVGIQAELGIPSTRWRRQRHGASPWVRSARRSGPCWATSWSPGRRTLSRSSRNDSSLTPGRRWGAATSCSPTRAR